MTQNNQSTYNLNHNLCHLVEEVATAININGVNYAVMMMTPDNYEDFAMGFLFTESIISHAYDVHDINLNPSPQGMNIEITVANRCFERFKHNKRQLAGNTGCGICGVTAIEQALPKLPKLSPKDPIQLTNLAQLKQQMQQYQIKAKTTGAIHAAFSLNAQAQIQLCREDLGRHNALDKLIGALLQQKQNCESLLVTSRCSSELINKAILFGAHNLISLASPSRLAVERALEHNLNLIHIPKQDSAIIYSNMQRPSSNGAIHV